VGILVIDAGTSSVRTCVVEPDGSVVAERSAATLPDSPAAGLVEFDATAYADAALALAAESLDAYGPVDGVGISNQRGSTVVWDRATGDPVAPAQGWQDLRTVGDCLVLAGEGIRLSPNQSATKLANILDAVDPDRVRDLCFGTPDSWIIWRLTAGRVHATDPTNAWISGLLAPSGSGWNAKVLERLRTDEAMLPTVLDSVGAVGEATALDGAPLICGVAGDQLASLVGQGCVRPGLTKITFGTGGMLDTCLGVDPPTSGQRGHGGTFPLICWQRDGERMWGVEGIMLSAGTNVQWLRDDLGLIESVEGSASVAAECESADGVVYVPAQLGLGTPRWDYGARGTLLGLTRGSTRAHVVRAVLEGVAHRGTDLVEAAQVDAGMAIESVRVDGGMSTNPVFRQALADASQRPVECAPVNEATSLGAAYLAGLHLGTWGGWDDVAASWTPTTVVEPAGTLDRDQWAAALDRAAGWYTDLSALDF
jgi:glycerol kinase